MEDDVDPNGIRTVKLMTTMPDFLTQKGIKWRLLSCNDAKSRLIVRHCQWIKKEMFHPGQKKKTGFRALGEVENSPALERFYVVDCENANRPDEPTAVYECSGPPQPAPWSPPSLAAVFRLPQIRCPSGSLANRLHPPPLGMALTDDCGFLADIDQRELRVA